MLEEPPENTAEPGYRSGIAARLAGIPVETLRVWERRYQVVGPRLSPRGHRVYSAADVGRLTLIRQLVDLGSAIGSIASLPLATLREMRAATSGRAPAGPAESPHPIRIAVVGEALSQRISRDGALHPALQVLATCAEPETAAAALVGVCADVLAVELPTLVDESVAAVRALTRIAGARRAIVAYRFGPAAVVGALRDQGDVVIRAPLDADALGRLARDAVASEAPRAPVVRPEVDAAPLPRFDDRALTQLSGALTTLYCECPRHVVDLLLSLGAFERYSAECANRSPADAILHRHLERVAGSARALFEDALVRIARAEGLPLPGESALASSRRPEHQQRV